MDLSSIREFLATRKYDIRDTHNARWIDQKCTIDVVCFISDCIIEYLEQQGVDEEFTISDIWHSDFSERITTIFSKPNTNNENAQNEYDKFFSQPIKMLAYANVLTERRVGNRLYFTVNNIELLRYLSIRERNTLEFLNEYIEKVLLDSGIMTWFSEFFDSPNVANFSKLKSNYENFIIRNTPINGITEVRRIFTKVLNPQSYKRRVNGTERGRLSRNPITYDMLMYNRDNFRDISSQKPKHLTRNEYIIEQGYNINVNHVDYQIDRAKRKLKYFTNLYYNNTSAVELGDFAITEAIHAHHIFTKSGFPEIAAYIENLIMLTPSQHLYLAHPNGNTQYVDEGFQHSCIIAKCGRISDNLNDFEQETLYSFDDLLYVLSIGYNNDEFFTIQSNDFSQLVGMINEHYNQENV